LKIVSIVNEWCFGAFKKATTLKELGGPWFELEDTTFDAKAETNENKIHR